jgi:hypothetical protein
VSILRSALKLQFVGILKAFSRVPLAWFDEAETHLSNFLAALLFVSLREVVAIIFAIEAKLRDRNS